MANLNVGIVGGGIAGLYTALLLQREGCHVRIFEGTDRIGGRVHTHYFTTEDNQYYEAGAMRIPNSDFHKIVFDLVQHINSRIPEDEMINLIQYILNAPGNELYINGMKPQLAALSSTPASVGWDVPDEYKNKTARELLDSAIGAFINDLKQDFDTAFKDIVIDFIETVTSQTNQFSLSVPELVMQNMDFDETDWKTIEGGMSRLPQAMASLVRHCNITFGARVTGLEETEDQRVRVTASGYNGSVSAVYDRVVLAIPPAALRMLVNRPRWSVEKEVAIRSIHFEALYKMGLRFKTRFWERVRPNASEGGQSTTDLPIRWIVYPSNAIGDDGPGVLLIYAWMTDASNWLPLTPIERRNLALECIARMYQGQSDGNKEINVYDLLIETSDAVWSQSTATGDAMFLPGQFQVRFDVARKPEGNIFFAGEHLSYHHTWISGAAESALQVVRDMLENPDLPPLEDSTIPEEHTESRLPATEPAKVPFEFKCPSPLFGRNLSDSSRSWPPVGHPDTPERDSDFEYNFPANLGMSGNILGADMTNLKAVEAGGS
ncbi:hypothetical protein F5Y10DRAFT_291301 [Nemania abortiva]|nr:hypothetical protein F5Y10DRAFT_291301 [Nemania abortiva]